VAIVRPMVLIAELWLPDCVSSVDASLRVRIREGQTANGADLISYSSRCRSLSGTKDSRRLSTIILIVGGAQVAPIERETPRLGETVVIPAHDEACTECRVVDMFLSRDARIAAERPTRAAR
jgi:hypothetical protein